MEQQRNLGNCLRIWALKRKQNCRLRRVRFWKTTGGRLCAIYPSTNKTNFSTTHDIQDTTTDLLAVRSQKQAKHSNEKFCLISWNCQRQIHKCVIACFVWALGRNVLQFGLLVVDNIYWNKNCLIFCHARL